MAVGDRIVPLEPIRRRFAQQLSERGYCAIAQRQYIYAADHFTKWLHRRPISDASAAAFMARHLPRCQCQRPAPRRIKIVRPALHQLLKMLGIERPPDSISPAADRLLFGYDDHLRRGRGLAETTIEYRLYEAREFLRALGVLRIAQLRSCRPEWIAEYVASAARRRRPRSGRVLGSSIRSFLRFLLLSGVIRKDLADAVPTFAHWRLSTLPVAVDRPTLEALLRRSDCGTAIGLRDRAVLLCMVDLGLRAADVASLSIEHVDLTARALRIDRRKQRRGTEVPMTPRLYEAVRRYLQHGRPTPAGNALFVHHCAPVGGRLRSMTVRAIILRCAARAGLSREIRGSRGIRHSVATSLINCGASMKEIADLLGHRSIDTTAIYAKVDLGSLRAVALPWPRNIVERP